MSNQQPLLDRAALRRDRHCASLLCPPACMFTTPGYGEAWRWMLPLACTFLNECVCLSMLYPFLGYMVLDFGLVESTNEAGLYGGYIASMFTLGQLLSGSFWGSASDRWGRRRVICIGLFNTMLLAPLFGLSRNLWQAMAVRFAMGLLSGNAAAAKAYIGEAGPMLLLGNLVLLPALRRRIPSSLALQRFAICAMAIPGFALFPLAAACCAGDDGAATLAVLPVFCLRITSVGLIFTLSFQFINGVVDEGHRSMLGGVTGAAQQAGNVARFLTPSASAWLVAWANASPYRFPLDHTLPFTLFGVAWLAPLYFNLRLKEADVAA